MELQSQVKNRSVRLWSHAGWDSMSSTHVLFSLFYTILEQFHSRSCFHLHPKCGWLLYFSWALDSLSNCLDGHCPLEVPWAPHLELAPGYPYLPLTTCLWSCHFSYDCWSRNWEVFLESPLHLLTSKPQGSSSWISPHLLLFLSSHSFS